MAISEAGNASWTREIGAATEPLEVGMPAFGASALAPRELAGW
jgi:hypothetical protein